MFQEITQNAQPSPNAEPVRGFFIAIDRWLDAEWHRDEGTFETLHHDTLVKSVVLNLEEVAFGDFHAPPPNAFVYHGRAGGWLPSPYLSYGSPDAKPLGDKNVKAHRASSQLFLRYCILCVEDDVSGLEARAALREEEGYCVTAVSCPMRALEFDVTEFHLAVLDFAMPALDRFQLLLRLRAAQASFPIVLLSGMSRDVPDNMRRVFSSCLDKEEPIDILLNTVRSYLAAIPDPPECGVMSSRTHYHYERPSHRRH